jgi:hypothetical protein
MYKRVSEKIPTSHGALIELAWGTCLWICRLCSRYRQHSVSMHRHYQIPQKEWRYSCQKLIYISFICVCIYLFSLPSWMRVVTICLSIYLSIYLYIYGCTVLLLVLGLFFSFLILCTVCRTPWTGDQPVTKPLQTHRINAHRHPCFEWNSNPRSQSSIEGRQFLPQTERPLWSTDCN